MKPLEIIVNRGTPGDPVAGQNQVVIPWLAGQDIWIEYSGEGPVRYGEYEVIAQGGFKWADPDRTFLPPGPDGVSDTYFIHTTGLSAPAPGHYSNGFQREPILNVLSGRLGWIQPTVAASPVLAGLNTVSNSGRYFNDGSFHAIVNPNTIKAVQENPAITDAQFNTLLVQFQQAAILRVLNGVFNKREILEKKLMFERFGRQDYADTASANPIFCGVRITPPASFDKSVQIDSLALLFSDTITLTFYLFHDSSPTVPLRTFQVTAIGKKQTVVRLHEYVLNYADENRSGYYYLGYFQKDLGSVTATNEILERFNSLYNFGLVPIELPVPAPLTIDANQLSFTTKTHGFNVSCTAFRDHTQGILDVPYLFDNAIGLMMAAMVVEIISNTVRSNKDERISKDVIAMIYKDLNADQSKGLGDFQPQVAGLKSQLSAELRRVKKEFYPCEKIETNTHDTDSYYPYGIPNLDIYRY